MIYNGLLWCVDWCAIVYCGVLWCTVVYCGLLWSAVVYCGLQWFTLDMDPWWFLTGVLTILRTSLMVRAQRKLMFSFLFISNYNFRQNSREFVKKLAAKLLQISRENLAAKSLTLAAKS